MSRSSTQFIKSEINTIVRPASCGLLELCQRITRPGRNSPWPNVTNISWVTNLSFKNSICAQKSQRFLCGLNEITIINICTNSLTNFLWKVSLMDGYKAVLQETYKSNKFMESNQKSTFLHWHYSNPTYGDTNNGRLKTKHRKFFI